MPNGEEEVVTITPPSSYRDIHELTPPPTNEKDLSAVPRILDIIKQYKRGRFTSDQCWLSFNINATEKTKLEQQLAADEFCTDKLRWDYFPRPGLFVIRMPTSVHESFLVKVHNDIQAQLRHLAEGGPSADFAKEVEFIGSTTYNPIDLNYGRHDPDGCFHHRKEWFPGVVTEVAYSSKGKMLGKLADDYILGSDLAVRALVGFDIGYNKKEATLSIWRPHLQREAGEEVWSVGSKTEVIRRMDGQPNNDPEAGLLLHLRDFASPKFCNDFDGEIDGNISISCKTLYDYLVEAESAIDPRSAPNGPNPLLRKRRRPSTPEEELDPDEETLGQAKGRATKRVDRDDTSYKDSSSVVSDKS